MKISVVCKRTGLSERTIRFYIEKGLLKPQSQVINGRVTTEYSEEDIEILLDISKLRNAGFSISDILSMQESIDNVNNIVLKHCSDLEQEQIFNEELIQELKEISKRGDITWRKLASILFRKKSNYVNERICCPLPEKMEIDENKDKTIWSYIKRGSRWGVLLLLIAFAIFIVAGNKHNEKILSTSFSLGLVIVEDKYIEGEQRYVEIYTVYPDAYPELYFASPCAVKVDSEEYYNSLHIKGVPNDSLDIWVEVPHIEAKQLELIDASENILIRNVLCDKELIKKYCTIKRIDNDY